MRESQGTMPNWVATITQRLREDTTLSVSDLAREVGRHASWLGTAYRRAVGEGLLDTAARYRVERAACLLRETDLPSAACGGGRLLRPEPYESNLPANTWAFTIRRQRRPARLSARLWSFGEPHRRDPRQCP